MQASPSAHSAAGTPPWAKSKSRAPGLCTGTADPHRSYDLYGSVGFRRPDEYVRYRKPIVG